MLKIIILKAEKAVEHKGDDDCCSSWNSFQKLQKETGKKLEIKERIETTQTTALMKKSEYLRVLETGGDLLSLRIQWKPSVKTGVKNLQGEK